MSNKFYTVEKIHELLTKYDASIVSYISSLSNGKGLSIYNNYSELPNNLTEDTVAYCKNDYIQTIIDETDGSTIEYKFSKGIYIYDNIGKTWKLYSGDQNLEQIEILLSDYMDKATFASEVNEGNVKIADKALKIDNIERAQPEQYYGKNTLGEIGFHYFPINPTTVPDTEQRYINQAISNQVYIINSAIDLNNTKLFIQCLKTVDGLKNISANIDIFNKLNIDSYYYNNDCIEFDNDNVHIKNNYEIKFNNSTTSDYNYESDIIKKDDFIEPIVFIENQSKSLVPNMTSNITPYPYSASCSSYESSSYLYEAYKAFNDYDGSWCCAPYDQNPYIMIDFGDYIEFNRISILAPHTYGSVNALEQSIRNCNFDYYDDVLADWVTVYTVGDMIYEQDVYHDYYMNGTIKCKKFRFIKYNNTLKYMSARHIKFYNDQKILVKYNDNLYNIVDNKLELTSNDFNNYFNIHELNGVELFDKFTLISNINTSYYISSIKSNQELIVPVMDLFTNIIDNIINIKSFASPYDTQSIKIAFTMDSGLTWNTYNDNGIEDLNINIPLKPYDEFTEDEINEWDNAKNIINTSGIGISDLTNLTNIDFNNLNMNSIRFAYVLNIANTSDICELQRTQITYDETSSYKVMKDSEVDINILNRQIKITPFIDNSCIKVNILS